MPAFTSIMLGLSALGGVAAVSSANKTKTATAAAEQKKLTAGREAAQLETFSEGQAGADVVLGTGGPSDKLLKAFAQGGKIGGGAGIGGLGAAPTVGGLK